MSNGRRFDKPGEYRIRVCGALDPAWEVWFDGFTIQSGPEGESTLIGPVADQAALHGLLAKIGDLGLPLLQVERIAERTEQEGSRCD